MSPPAKSSGQVWTIGFLAELKNLAYMAGTPVITCLYIFACTASFSRNLYGEIPATLGGGKPRIVRVVAKSELTADLTAAGIRFPGGARTSEPAKLLMATDKEYVFLTGPEGSSVGVRSDIVEAILYDGR